VGRLSATVRITHFNSPPHRVDRENGEADAETEM